MNKTKRRARRDMKKNREGPFESRFLPFKREFRGALLRGSKTKTSRTKRMGFKKGDLFHTFGALFRVRNVERLTLEQVSELYYEEEGLKSPSEFRQIWMKIHPRLGWMPEKMVYVLTFKRVDKGGRDD